MDKMTPSRPYFVRAMFDWVVDNDCTPYLSVFAGFPTVDVPLEFVEDEHITLNISPSAVAEFHMDNEAISFKARFSGVSRSLYVPMGAIVGLFAKENGHGMGFPDEPFYEAQAESLAVKESEELKTVKQPFGVVPESHVSQLDASEVDGEPKDAESIDKDKLEKPKKSNVSHLKVIK